MKKGDLVRIIGAIDTYVVLKGSYEYPVSYTPVLTELMIVVDIYNQSGYKKCVRVDSLEIVARS